MIDIVMKYVWLVFLSFNSLGVGMGPIIIDWMLYLSIYFVKSFLVFPSFSFPESASEIVEMEKTKVAVNEASETAEAAAAKKDDLHLQCESKEKQFS